MMDNPRFAHKRIVVIGTTSSGKSTLAQAVAEKLGLDFVELDALYWQPNWTPATPEAFRASVLEATRSQGWVVAGNYHVVRDLIWPRAQVVIWLDYSFPTVFWRLVTRTLRRYVTQEELWNGNREKLWWHFKIWSDESLFYWLFKTYWRRKREIPVLMQWPEYEHLDWLHHRSPRETERWLSTLAR